ncbi:MAG: glycosyltransferase [Gemmataceae bacterium]|nr:glycosyltransferase [Gemmataceae bacterium]
MGEIALLIDSMEFSGPARQALSLALEFTSQGRKIALCSLGKSTPWLNKAEEAGAVVEALNWQGVLDLAPLFRLRQWLKKRPARVIAFGASSLNAMALVAPKLLGRTLAFLHPRMLKRPSWFFKKTLARVEKALCPTLQMREFLSANGLGEKAIHLAPGISPLLHPVLPKQEKPPYLYLGGPFHQFPGNRDTVWAMDILYLVRPELRLLAIGEGKALPEIQEFQQALNSPGAVQFPGACRAVEPLLDGAEMVLVPNHSPGGIYSVLEGMLAGKTVLASRVPGMEEILRHGETGILIEPGEPALWAREIHSLLDDADKRQRVGDNARLAAGHYFSAKRNASSLLALYDRG